MFVLYVSVILGKAPKVKGAPLLCPFCVEVLAITTTTTKTTATTTGEPDVSAYTYVGRTSAYTCIAVHIQQHFHYMSCGVGYMRLCRHAYST